MQKLRITHYHTKIKYLATQETHTINVLLAPYEIVNNILENKIHPLSSGSKIRYAVLYREDSPKGISSSGDLTPYIVREANPQKLTFNDEELYTLFNTQLQNLVTNNFNVPQFIAECSDTDSKTLEVENDKEEIKAVLSVLQKTAPDYLKCESSTKQNNTVPTDIKEKAKKILDFLKQQDPSIQAESYIMDKEGNIQKLDDTPSTNTQIKKPKTETKPVEKKEPIRGALKELMTKYSKEQLQELYQNMPRAKLLENYPEDEIKELESFIEVDTK